MMYNILTFLKYKVVELKNAEEMSKCKPFENEGSKRNQEISNVILLNYSSNGDQKFGVVKLMYVIILIKMNLII